VVVAGQQFDLDVAWHAAIMPDAAAGWRASYAATVSESPVERCDGCGFEWDAVPVEEIRPRLHAAAEQFRVVFAAGGSRLLERPDPDTWSAVEYGCHVRDVLLNVRDRMIVGLAQDNPTPKPMFAALRVDAGLYAADHPDNLAVEIPIAAGLLDRTLAALTDDQLGRRIFYAWPRPVSRTLRWVAAQALHEAEHHLGDVNRVAS
jgi:hypothetical protein